MRALPATLATCLLVSGGGGLPALESTPVVQPGIRSVRLITDHPSIRPGETFTVGLLLEPQPGHHTYWRGPGIVGVATRIAWNLPPGFRVGELLWPPPEEVDMAGILAQGHSGPVLLLTEITAPADLGGDAVEIAGRASWMACAQSCNPGVADLALVLPVRKEAAPAPADEAIARRFAEARARVPRPAPGDWAVSVAANAPDRLELRLRIPGFDPAKAAGIRFFCDDMQVDSDEAQDLVVDDAASGTFHLVLRRPEFAPASPEALSGVLFHPQGWPETGSNHVEIRAPWPKAP